MVFVYLFVFLLCHLVACDDEALRECANIHHISIQVIPNVHATFTNYKCLLTCLVDNKTLASDPINEGVACPQDWTGICQNGQCIGGLSEALLECTKLHSLDFHLVRNSGTQYTNSLCQLNCVIDGNLIGLHAINEGMQCPKDFNGLCRNGKCVTTSETVPTAPTTAPTTAPANITTPVVPSVNPVTSQTPTVSTVTAYPLFGDYCKGHKTGDYVIDPHDRHVYYECMVGRAIKFTCPDSALHGRLVFDTVKKVCVFPSEA